MDKLVLNYHSFVDVITNSSTEMFTTPHRNTVENCKKLINNILQIAGSDKTCDDLFNVKITHSNYEDEVVDMTEEDFDEYEGYDERKLVIEPKDSSVDSKYLGLINDLFTNQEFMC